MTRTITCTSTGGPATDVIWSKDNTNISTASNKDFYEQSQVIKNTVSATYENRLRIVDKSSKAAGTYTCEVTNSRGSINQSLYIKGNNIKTAVLDEKFVKIRKNDFSMHKNNSKIY